MMIPRKSTILCHPVVVDAERFVRSGAALLLVFRVGDSRGLGLVIVAVDGTQERLR